MLTLAVLAANAGAWTDTSVLVTNVRNFPNQRGTIVGAHQVNMHRAAYISSDNASNDFAQDVCKFSRSCLTDAAPIMRRIWVHSPSSL